ncbi:MAG: hypothetical protein HQ539_01445 [Parcubacteria group bacterium]|nr:hypothetical protein [Parcubacteria group bacterium]
MTKNNTEIVAFELIRSCFEKIYKIEKKWIHSGRISEVKMKKQNEAYDKLDQLEIWFDKQGLDWEELINKVYKIEFEEKFRVLK